MIQKALVNVEISYNECIGPSCILRETRVIRPGILVVRGITEAVVRANDVLLKCENPFKDHGLL